jgi:hypothetical protein
LISTEEELERLPNDGLEEDQPDYEYQRNQLIERVRDEITKKQLETSKAGSNASIDTLKKRWKEMEDMLRELDKS